MTKGNDQKKKRSEFEPEFMCGDSHVRRVNGECDKAHLESSEHVNTEYTSECVRACVGSGCLRIYCSAIWKCYSEFCG